MDFLHRQTSLIQEGKHYQFAQTVFNRAKRHFLKKEYQTSLQVATFASKILLQKGEKQNSKELLKLIVDSSPFGEVKLEEIEQIVFLLGDHSQDFLVNLAENSKNLQIFALVADLKENKGKTGQSLYYWAHAENFGKLIRTLQVLIDRGFPGEVDLFVTRTVLMILSFNNLQFGSQLIGNFKSVQSPLMNFTNFLLQALDLKEHSLFLILKEKYRKSLARDNQLAKYLKKIEEVYFN